MSCTILGKNRRVFPLLTDFSGADSKSTPYLCQTTWHSYRFINIAIQKIYTFLNDAVTPSCDGVKLCWLCIQFWDLHRKMNFLFLLFTNSVLKVIFFSIFVAIFMFLWRNFLRTIVKTEIFTAQENQQIEHPAIGAVTFHNISLLALTV